MIQDANIHSSVTPKWDANDLIPKHSYLGHSVVRGEQYNAQTLTYDAPATSEGRMFRK